MGPIQLFGKTFFKQVKLYLGSKLAYDSGDTYAYRSYIETELNFNESYKMSFLQAAGFQPDQPTDELDTQDTEGWTKTVSVVQKQPSCRIHGSIACGLVPPGKVFNQQNGCSIGIAQKS